MELWIGDWSCDWSCDDVDWFVTERERDETERLLRGRDRVWRDRRERENSENMIVRERERAYKNG